MKLYGIFGKGSGKMGSSVFAISGGEQLVREYNPNVANPNTESQIAQRAKFKLMSQIATALSGVIAMKKEGLVSKRNKFVSRNFALASYEDGRASVTLSALQIAGSVHVITALESGESNNIVQLSDAPNREISGVVYIALGKDENNNLIVSEVKNVTSEGANFQYPATFAATLENKVVLAYAYWPSTSGSTTDFGSAFAEVEENIAHLDIAEVLTAAGASFSSTVGLVLGA